MRKKRVKKIQVKIVLYILLTRLMSCWLTKSFDFLVTRNRRLIILIIYFFKKVLDEYENKLENQEV